MGESITEDYYHHADDSRSGSDSSERGMMLKFIDYLSEHFSKLIENNSQNVKERFHTIQEKFRPRIPPGKPGSSQGTQEDAFPS